MPGMAERQDLERYGFAEAKDQLSALTAQANATGLPFIVTKNGKPWVEVRPLATRKNNDGGVVITPIRREVEIPNVDELFRTYDNAFIPHEDGFASPAGIETM